MVGSSLNLLRHLVVWLRSLLWICAGMMHLLRRALSDKFLRMMLVLTHRSSHILRVGLLIDPFRWRVLWDIMRTLHELIIECSLNVTLILQLRSIVLTHLGFVLIMHASHNYVLIEVHRWVVQLIMSHCIYWILFMWGSHQWILSFQLVRSTRWVLWHQ